MVKYNKPTVIEFDQSFVFPTHLNYGKYVLDRLLLNKKKTALIDGATDLKLTYGELAQKVVNIASSFNILGFKQGDVVGICSENRFEFLTTAIGASLAGAVITFINSAYSKDEFVHTMKISKPRFMFLSPKTYEVYSKTIGQMEFVEKMVVFDIETSKENIINFNNLTSKEIDIDSYQAENFSGSERTALILYSSGTTGLPKGAKLSHRNLITSGLQTLFRSSNSRAWISLSLAPWSNTVGILVTMRELIYGQTVVFMNKFVEDTYFKCIEKYKVEILLAVPSLVVLLTQSKIVHNYNVSTVEYIYCGGAPLDQGIMTEAKKTFPNLKNVLQGYGMTEASGALTEEKQGAPRPGSIGTIVQGNIIKIVDVDTRQLLGPNQPGEVCVKGSVLFQGYIGKDLKDDLDEEGFYKTGDIAYYDEDGYFYIVDRLKELIKYKAGQVAPSELEAILRHHPAVIDVGVTGAPDRLAGELPTAFVVKAPGSNVTEQELVDFVAPKVSSWKQLRGGVRFVREIPKTASGKILRRKLREHFTKPTSKL